MRGTGGRGGRDDPVALARAAYRVEAPFGGTRQTQEEQVRGGVGVGWVKFEVRDRSTEHWRRQRAVPAKSGPVGLLRAVRGRAERSLAAAAFTWGEVAVAGNSKHLLKFLHRNTQAT